ncbi:MAG: response regulator, partial [Rhodobacteraceae bacterium]|nr:response regulator [Paracoccaceae bacterium]
EETETCRLRFAVSDTGVGMTAAEVAVIFTQFERVGSQQRAGTGLGLAISRRLVQAMGGELLVESEPGVGSTFEFDIEVPVVQAAVKETAVSSQQIMGYTGARQKILVVDDDESNLGVLCNLLEPMGFEVATAKDGREAVAQAQLNHPHLVLMDLVMPNMDGLEATRTLRQLPDQQAVPIIAVSAKAFAADRKEATAAGCNAFLPKPIDARELFALLQTHLALEWTYAEVDAVTIPLSDAPLVIPPQEVLASLYDLAQRGNLRAIEKKAAELIQVDAQYEPFAHR